MPVTLSARDGDAGESPVAWVDESGSNAQIDPGTYILAAGLTWPQDVEGVRLCMRSLLLPGQEKLHWRDEDARRRRLIAAALTDLPVEHLVVVTGEHSARVRPERRRRVTLARLFRELEECGVERAVLESRGPADDQRDHALLQYLRTQRQVSRLRIDHRRGRQEPVLWVPDAAAGIVTAKRCGDSGYFDMIESRTTLIEIPQS